MRDNREFIIQRYTQDTWPELLGAVPFFVTGQGFKNFAIPYSLEKYKEWRFDPRLKRALAATFPVDGIHRTFYHQNACAEFLLREYIVQAVWAIDQPEYPADDRMNIAIYHLAKQIPYDITVGVTEGVIEYLSGLCDLGHYKEFVAIDGLRLEGMVIV
jgi:hypothetical protein